MGIKTKISEIERNSQGFITSIKIKLTDEGKSQIMSANWESSQNEKGIPDISIGRKNGKLIISSNN